MKRRILITIVAFIVLSQTPFAYRRYRLHRLRRTIQELSAQRVVNDKIAPGSLPLSAANDYVDYKGVIHVHSFLGGHSTGTFAELIAAAKADQLDFVVMTEHPQSDFDTSAMTLNGLHAGVLFVNGNEVVSASGDRLLLIPGPSNAAAMNALTTQQIIDQQKASGALTIAAYPTESQNWQTTTVNGVEVYNLFTNSRAANPVTLFFDGLWSYRSYADLMFANFFHRPDENLKRWDDAIAATHRKLIAIAGNDAHSNIGVSLDDASGKQLVGIKLDPYERSFRVVRIHVLIKKAKGLSRDSLLEALSQGHCYISFDLFSDATGFRFQANDANAIMGDEVVANESVRLIARTPLPARIVLMKDGAKVDEKSGTAGEFQPNGAGVYRVELYLNDLPTPAAGKPWIISNPIFLR